MVIKRRRATVSWYLRLFVIVSDIRPIGAFPFQLVTAP